jgi:hypothetical protein
MTDIDETSQFVPNESMQDIRDGLGFEDELMDDLKVAFSNGDFSSAEDEADAMIESNGVTSIEKHAPEYRRLCAKILEVDIRLWPILKKARLLDFTYAQLTS